MANDVDVDALANSLFTSLTTDTISPPVIDLTGPQYTFTVDPNSTLYTAPTDITVDQLTTVSLDGTGIFDKMMKSVDLHINREFKNNRITSDEYAKVYTELISNVLSTSTQFLLNKDASRWQGIEAQMKARVAEIEATTALIDLEKSKMDAAKSSYDMQNSNADYALTKMKIANADAEHCLLLAQEKKETFSNNKLLPVALAQEQHKLTCTLPLQTNLIKEQVQKERAQTLDTRLDNMTPISGMIGLQKKGVIIDNTSKQFALDNTLPTQLDLIREQRESERAKTLDTRTDGATVVGSTGKQKDLYTQQIDSFIKDAKYKTAKMYLDGWITQKTLDEGLLAPSELQNAKIDSVLSGIRTENNL